MARMEFINSSIGHNLTHGEENESAIRELLTSILPSAYGVGSGVIVGVDGEASRQIDIIVYDRTRANMTLAANSRLFFADQVLLTIELKTRFTSGDNSSLSGALENTASVKRLKVAPHKWVESRPDPSTGELAFTSYSPSTPVGVIFFFAAPETSGPLDLESFFETLKSAVDLIPLDQQPDLLFSLGHASVFRHIDIGCHEAATQQFSATLVQSAEDKAQVLVLPKDVGPLKAIMNLSRTALSAGVLNTFEIPNLKKTSKVQVVSGDQLFEEPETFRVVRVGDAHYLLDRVRAFLVFVETIERLLRIKRPNPLWSGADYFGPAWPLSSAYPDDFETLEKSVQS